MGGRAAVQRRPRRAVPCHARVLGRARRAPRPDPGRLPRQRALRRDTATVRERLDRELVLRFQSERERSLRAEPSLVPGRHRPRTVEQRALSADTVRRGRAPDGLRRRLGHRSVPDAARRRRDLCGSLRVGAALAPSDETPVACRFGTRVRADPDGVLRGERREPEQPRDRGRRGVLVVGRRAGRRTPAPASSTAAPQPGPRAQPVCSSLPAPSG